MADRPIIFSAPMIKALLDGRKTQTRRVLKEQRHIATPAFAGGRWQWLGYSGAILGDIRIPYAPGDLLWVMEAWARVPVSAYRASEGVDQRQSPFDYEAAIYRAGFDRSQGGIHWRSPIHMPIWASRLTLLVTDVRVQRLQEISAEDVTAEGIPFESDALAPYELSVSRFADLWNSIHGPDAWDANPWVAAISFTVHRCNIDTMEEGTW